MSENWKSANARMACLDCGESGAHAYTTTKGKNPGRYVRVCRQCLDRWAEFGLQSRGPMYEEPGSLQKVG
jgi:ribosomal protein L33